MVVLVCGRGCSRLIEVGDPSVAFSDSYRRDIETLLPYAEEHNIKLAIEPLHPMYADSFAVLPFAP